LSFYEGVRFGDLKIEELELEVLYTNSTALHATVTKLTRKVEEYGHKLCMVSLISSPDLFNDLTKKSKIVVELSD
jgi:hypothetical protein